MIASSRYKKLVRKAYLIYIMPCPVAQ